MPLKQTIYGGECPLGKFKIDISAGAGSYDKDSLETCLNCNFSDNFIEELNLEKLCQCPSEMNWKEYDRLRKEYSSTEDKLTKEGFWKFVKENYRKD